jgi:hypothetical protein
MATGYVKLHRSVIEHWVFAHDGVFYLWTNLLMRANWKDGKFWPGGSTQPMTIARGQFVTGRSSLHSLLYPTHDSLGRVIRREQKPPHATTVWRWLQALEKDGMVALHVRSSFTIVTISNYDTYQGRDGDECATDAPQMRQPCAARAPLVRTIEEGKESKEGKKVKNAAAAVPVPEVLLTPEFEAAWADWKAHRIEIRKPLKPTQEAEQLRQFALWGVPRAVAAIRHTILKGWQGVREPDTDRRQMPLMELPKLGGNRS